MARVFLRAADVDEFGIVETPDARRNRREPPAQASCQVARARPGPQFRGKKDGGDSTALATEHRPPGLARGVGLEPRLFFQTIAAELDVEALAADPQELGRGGAVAAGEVERGLDIALLDH